MAFHYCINDIHDVCAIIKGRKQRFFWHDACLHRTIKLRHHILKRIRPAFDMPAREVGAVCGITIHQARIVRQRLVGLRTMANP
ncbi:hypothetical protein D3C80_806160 [compost metagenome]